MLLSVIQEERACYAKKKDAAMDQPGSPLYPRINETGDRQIPSLDDDQRATDETLSEAQVGSPILPRPSNINPGLSANHVCAATPCTSMLSWDPAHWTARRDAPAPMACPVSPLRYDNRIRFQIGDGC